MICSPHTPFKQLQGLRPMKATGNAPIVACRLLAAAEVPKLSCTAHRPMQHLLDSVRRGHVCKAESRVTICEGCVGCTHLSVPHVPVAQHSVTAWLFSWLWLSGRRPAYNSKYSLQ